MSQSVLPHRHSSITYSRLRICTKSLRLRHKRKRKRWRRPEGPEPEPIEGTYTHPSRRTCTCAAAQDRQTDKQTRHSSVRSFVRSFAKTTLIHPLGRAGRRTTTPSSPPVFVHMDGRAEGRKGGRAARLAAAQATVPPPATPLPPSDSLPPTHSMIALLPNHPSYPRLHPQLGPSSAHAGVAAPRPGKVTKPRCRSHFSFSYSFLLVLPSFLPSLSFSFSLSLSVYGH